MINNGVLKWGTAEVGPVSPVPTWGNQRHKHVEQCHCSCSKTRYHALYICKFHWDLIDERAMWKPLISCKNLWTNDLTLSLDCLTFGGNNEIRGIWESRIWIKIKYKINHLGDRNAIKTFITGSLLAIIFVVFLNYILLVLLGGWLYIGMYSAYLFCVLRNKLQNSQFSN